MGSVSRLDRVEHKAGHHIIRGGPVFILQIFNIYFSKRAIVRLAKKREGKKPSFFILFFDTVGNKT